MHFARATIEQLRDTEMLSRVPIVNPEAIVAPDICASDPSIFAGGFFYIFVRWLTRFICSIVRLDRRSWCGVVISECAVRGVASARASAAWRAARPRTDGDEPRRVPRGGHRQDEDVGGPWASSASRHPAAI